MKRSVLKKRILFYFLAGVIPALLWANIFSGPEITQNQYTILTSDLNGQYISYLMYFRNAMLSGKNLSYSFSSLLGNGTAALRGYYLMSPLNLIVLLFPASQIARAVYWILLIKCALSGMTSAFLFGRKCNDSYKALLFSTTYALSGYTFAYFVHLMWMDSVVLLPVAAVGIEKLVDERKTVFYSIALAVNLAVCYYTGYMAAGFCLLYFLFLLLEKKRSGKENRTLILQYLRSTVLGGMLACVILIPVLVNQSMNGSSIHSFDNPSQSFADAAAGLFSGTASAGNYLNGAPHLYVGMLMIFLDVLYLMPHHDHDQRRILSSVLVLMLFLGSVMDGKIDLIWHLFSSPHGFNHRYAFTIVLFLLILAERSFRKYLSSLTVKEAVIADAVIAVLAFIAICFSDKVIHPEFVWIDLISLVIISLIFCCFRSRKGQRLRSLEILLMAVQVFMLSMNGFQWLSVHEYDDHSTEGYYAAYHGITAEIQQEDSGLYRMEKTFLQSENDSMLLGYNGMSFFSSADQQEIRDLMGKLGYSQNYMWAGYGNGATPAADSFFGVKYLLFLHEIPSLSENLKLQTDKVYVYENPYALPFGFAVQSGSFELNFGDDVFQNQEVLYSTILGRNVHFFQRQTEQNAKAETHGARLSSNNSTGNEISTEADNGSIRYSFTVQEGGPVFLYFYHTDLSGIEVSVNGGEREECCTEENHGIIPLGEYQKGDTLYIDLYPESSHFQFSRMELVSMNLSEFQKAASEVQRTGWNVESFEEINIHATVDTDGGLYLTTIPYDRGWSVMIDGKKTSSLKTSVDLLAFPVEKGTHAIELQYHIVGMKAGILMTVLGVMLLLVHWHHERLNRPSAEEDT